MLDGAQEKEDHDVFTALLKDQRDERQSGRSAVGHRVCSIRNRFLSTIPCGFTLVSAFLCGSFLIALALNTDRCAYTLLTWDTDKSPAVLQTAAHLPITCDGVEAESGLLYRIPFLVASVAHTGGSCSVQHAMLTREFFTMLFGPEKVLSFSYILMLGSQTGHVYYCDLSRNACADSESQESGAEVLCCLEQPVLHMSQFCGADRHDIDGFLFLAVSGKVILCVKGDSNHTQVIFKQFSLLGPISSAAFFTKIGLLYSTRGSVKLACLKPSCLSVSGGELSSHFPPLESLFDYPVTISHGPLSLVCLLDPSLQDDRKPLLQLVALDPEDDITLLSVSAQLPSVSDNIHSHMPVEVCKSKLQDILKILVFYESSCSKVKQESELVDSMIQNIGSAISIFSSITTQRSSLSRNIPFKYEARILCQGNEIGVGQAQQLLNFRIHYHGCSPLGYGWSVVFLVRDGGHQESFSASANISGLGIGQTVVLNYPAPHSILPLSHIVVDCLLHFNPDLHASHFMNSLSSWCGVSMQIDSACVVMQTTD